MDKDPKQHPFTPLKTGGDSCKWCPFHKNAHREATPAEKAALDRSETIQAIKEAQSGS
jgi:hypothetical protein